LSPLVAIRTMAATGPDDVANHQCNRNDARERKHHLVES
jgi:hypothetical protein